MPCVNELVGAVARQEPSVVVLHALYRQKSVQSYPVNELSPVEQCTTISSLHLDLCSVRKVGDCGDLRNPLPYIGEQVTEIIREGQIFIQISLETAIRPVGEGRGSRDEKIATTNIPFKVHRRKQLFISSLSFDCPHVKYPCCVFSIPSNRIFAYISVITSF